MQRSLVCGEVNSRISIVFIIATREVPMPISGDVRSIMTKWH